MKMHNLNPKEFAMDEIVSIELIGEKDTVDITVEDTHMFFANDVYSHNSALEDDVIGAEKISEDYSKIMTADFVVSLSRKLEDKVAGTGRIHVIKNRFGPDGITFPTKMNASNGKIDIYDSQSTDGKTTQKSMDNGEDYTRKLLKNKFKELTSG